MKMKVVALVAKTGHFYKQKSIKVQIFSTPKMSFMALVNKKLLSLKAKLLLFLRQTLVYIIETASLILIE